jgi:hypothetical protein
MAEREERPGTSAAAAAAEQVRAIVEAAERSAAALEAAAREEAARIRAEAEAEASTKREAAARLADRADELERRLDELVEGVRTAVAGLKEDLEELRAGERPMPVEAATEQPVAAVTGADVDPTIAEAEVLAAPEPDVPDTAEDQVPAVGHDSDTAPEGARESDTAPEGARVLALKMALDGTPREETARYLRENFELEDPEALLDEVYARAGG